MMNVKTGEEIDFERAGIKREDGFDLIAYIECDNKPKEAFLYRKPDGFYYEVLTAGVVTETFATNRNFTEAKLLDQCTLSLEGRRMPTPPEEW